MNTPNSLKDAMAKSRQIALYACMTIPDYYTVMEVRYVDYDQHYQTLPDGQKRENAIEGYVRVSEPVVVGFRAIDNDEIVRRAVESLDEAERKAIAELNAKIAGLRQQKAALLALTHEVAA